MFYLNVVCKKVVSSGSLCLKLVRLGLNCGVIVIYSLRIMWGPGGLGNGLILSDYSKSS